jgi:hypothetical protein
MPQRRPSAPASIKRRACAPVTTLPQMTSSVGCLALMYFSICGTDTRVSTAQHSTAQHSTAQYSTAQHSTAQHSTAQHSTAQHSTAQHSTCVKSSWLRFCQQWHPQGVPEHTKRDIFPSLHLQRCCRHPSLALPTEGPDLIWSGNKNVSRAHNTQHTLSLTSIW